MKEIITVIGAGSWGTAIANLLATNDNEVCAISDIKEICEEINQKNTHSISLPGVDLEKNLRCSLDLATEAVRSDLIYIVVPSNVVPIIIEQLSKLQLKENCGFIICTKGLDHKSLKFFHQILEEKIPGHDVAILSGPNFAIEVAQKIPSVTDIASYNSDFAARVIQTLNNENFKALPTDQVLISEICAVVKNIIAIACGINDGLQLGENSKAAIAVTGLSEIMQLARGLGAKNVDTQNAAGFGDIFLTCSTSKSRNNSLGNAIGQGEKYSELKKQKTYEGAINAQSICKLAEQLGLQLKLCNFVKDTLEAEPSTSEIKANLRRIICS